MKPSNLIDELVAGFGHFANKRDMLLELVKKAVRLIEEEKDWEHMINSGSTVTSAGSYTTSISIGDGKRIIDIEHSYGTIKRVPVLVVYPYYQRRKNGLNAFLFYTEYRKGGNLIVEFPGDGVGDASEDVTTSYSYFKFSTISAETTDYPFLDVLYEDVRNACFSFLSSIGKDMDRFNLFEVKFNSHLGRSANAGR